MAGLGLTWSGRLA